MLGLLEIDFLLVALSFLCHNYFIQNKWNKLLIHPHVKICLLITVFQIAILILFYLCFIGNLKLDLKDFGHEVLIPIPITIHYINLNSFYLFYLK
jgi:hypothetical protein